MKDINATVIVNLKLNEEEMYNSFPRDIKRGIKKAKNYGLIVKETKVDKDWEEFYEIYKKTMEEGKTTPKTLDKLKDKTHAFFICKKNEKIIGGGGIWFIPKYDIKIPRLSFAAFLKEYGKAYPMDILYWNCFLWAKNKNYDKFDLGGWQINAKGHLKGINKFKERWGEIVYYYRNYPLHIAIGRKLVRNFKFFWWLNRKLKE